MDTKIWAGTEDSFLKCEEFESRKNDNQNVAQDNKDKLYLTQDGVAVLNIDGPLTSGYTGPFGRMFGVLGYDDINEALIQAATDKTVNSILLNINSPGGAVSGVQDLATSIKKIAKYKPIVAYSGGMMSSAAMWLGSSASYVMASDTAIVGSIGVVRVHLDKSEQLKQDGVKAAVIRAGKEKALGSPYEPLSKEAKDILQAQADDIYDIFISHVADARGMNKDAADKQFGQGKEFLGKRAVEAGLIDATGSFDEAFAKAQDLGKKKQMKSATPQKTLFGANAISTFTKVPETQDVKSEALKDNSANLQGAHMPQHLTEEQLAAAVAGVELTAQAEQPTEAPAAATPEQKPEIKPEVPVDSATSILQAMVEKAQTDLVACRVELAAKSAELDTLKVQANASLDIARASVKTMGLHFGLKAESVAAMSAAEVLSEHTRLSALFKEKFKVGGVAATTTEVDKPKAYVPPFFAAVTKPASAAA